MIPDVGLSLCRPTNDTSQADTHPLECLHTSMAVMYQPPKIPEHCAIVVGAHGVSLAPSEAVPAAITSVCVCLGGSVPDTLGRMWVLEVTVRRVRQTVVRNRTPKRESRQDARATILL